MQPDARTDGGGEAATARRRAVAYLVDLVLAGGLALAAVDRSERSPAGRALAFVLSATAGGTLYHVLLEGSRGRTVGKRVVGIEVVREDGSDCGYRAAAVRTALRVADALPAGYLVGLLCLRLTERRQRLGDVAAGTVVVRTRDGRN